MTIIKMVLLLISRCDVQCSAMLAKLQRGCNSFLEIAIFSTVKRKVIDWLHLAEQPNAWAKQLNTAELIVCWQEMRQRRHFYLHERKK